MRATVLVPSLVAGLLLSVPLLTACQGDSLTPGADKEKDRKARVDYYETAALTYYDGGRYDLAERQFRKVLAESPQDKRSKRGLAKSLYMAASADTLNRSQRAAKLREAQKLLEEIEPLDWPNPGGTGSRRYEVQTDLAMVYSDLADLYDRDVRDLRYAMKNDPTSKDQDYQGTIDVQLAKRNALLHKAMPLFRQVMRASPDNPYAMAGLAKSNLQLGNDERGIYWAQRYVNLSRDSQRGWKERMEEYAQAVHGQMTEQMRKVYIDKIQGAREKEKRMHLMLASVHMRRNEFAQAIAEYTEVVRMDSGVPAAYLERAQAFAMIQDFKHAISDLEEYLKITDPQVHRQQRLDAVELLDRYQTAAARAAANRPTRPLGARPAAPGPVGSPDGSPDGNPGGSPGGNPYGSPDGN